MHVCLRRRTLPRRDKRNKVERAPTGGGRMAEGANMKLGSRGNFVLHCCCLPPKQYCQIEARMSLAEVRICPLEV